MGYDSGVNLRGGLGHLEWGALCEHAWRLVASPAARSRREDEHEQPIADELLPRSSDPAEVGDALARVRGLEVAMRDAAGLDDELRASVSGELGIVTDIGELLQRTQRGGALEIEELCEVADVVGAGRRLSAMLRAVQERAVEEDAAPLRSLVHAVEGLDPPGDLARELDRCLDRSGEPRLHDDASEILGRLRSKAAAARRALTVAAERLLRSPKVGKAVADRYFTEREGRLVFPVRNDAFSRAGGEGTISGIIHGSSGSGQTLFVEPHALVDLGNARREAAMAVSAEERRILARLARRVGEAAEPLRRCLDGLVELDRIHVRLRLGQAVGGVEPRVCAADGNADLELPAARHPLMALAGIDVVANDLNVRAGTGLVLSGPNAGGKTVALKTMGLLVLMAQAGVRLPIASVGSVPLYRRIVTDVGDDQSIAGGLSTFSAHVGHVMEALEAAEQDAVGTLVLLDEVAVGTDPEQGAALAEAILVELVQRGATLCVTTHYERLKLLASTRPESFANAAVGFDFEQLRPTFRVRLGPPGASSALTVARRLGLPETVLERAASLLDDKRVHVDRLLRDVETERERLQQERAAVEAERVQLEARLRAIEARERREEATAASRRTSAHEAAASALRELETEIKRRRKALRAAGPAAVDETGVTDADARGFAREARRALDGARPSADAPAGAAPETLARGDRVQVVGLGAEGEVVAVDGDRITVQLPLARTTVDRGQLRPVLASRRRTREPTRTAPPAPKSTAGRHFGADAEPVEARFDNVVDIRGVRADEALTMVEVFLDRAIADDVEVVIVRHGHGSGALRKAVREHLPHLAHAHRHRAGLPAEGGDAVTVVWVRG
jgi:DNA mismatch repair protein MutS2